jgi:uncharacterized protein
MDAIFIPQLVTAPEKTEEIKVKEFLPGLETLTAVRGVLKVQHQGNYLDVSAQAEAIVTLTCYRCLQQYNHKVVIDTSEVIWLDPNTNQVDNLPLEREVAMEDLVESLPPDGHFYPSEWLYEQMCLAIPLRQLCDASCAGIPANNISSTDNQLADKRWSSLEALKKNLPG